MPAARFYAISLPISCAYVTWRLTDMGKGRKTAATLFVTFLLINQVYLATRWHMPYVKSLQDAEDRALGAMVDDLNSVATKSDVLALSDIGRASYGYVGGIFDWWGLASRQVRLRNEAIGNISSQTIRAADPQFLVVYSNTANGPNSRVAQEGMSLASLSIISDEQLMSRYCAVKAYRFWDNRYHVLLARTDVFNRIGRLSEEGESMPTAWAMAQCVVPNRQ